MDGAWTGHPDQNEIAVSSFPAPNQIHLIPDAEFHQPNLREWREVGAVTEQGTRDAIRTCIRYRQGVTEGSGASLLDGYMEDLATDRIYRVLICQRIDRGIHTEQAVLDMFFDEFKTLGNEYQEGYLDTISLIKDRQFNPI